VQNRWRSSLLRCKIICTQTRSKEAASGSPEYQKEDQVQKVTHAEAFIANALSVADAAKGFMPPDEAVGLRVAAWGGAQLGPLLEVGSYCGKSAVHLGLIAHEHNTLLFSVDHHRGSEENQAGWEWHDTEVVDTRINKMDTLPFFRATIHDAGLEGTVVALVGQSRKIASHWRTPLGLLFIDGGHGREVAHHDYDGWVPHVMPRGLLAIHDVFPNPAEGGRPPYELYLRALADGFEPLPEFTVGSLRVLRRAS
jgi:MMP 1-O-methyltransferase